VFAIGYDLGSSSIKAALINLHTGAVVARTQEPDTEMTIDAPQPGWAEQDPELWWSYLCTATKRIIKMNAINAEQIISVGISYQMHGLVLVDQDFKVARPSIIWCDSRAVALGNRTFSSVGEHHCLQHYLNSPGNFTAAKLKWVKENEPETYARTKYAMLPGDFIALRLSGEASTTVTGLSEGVFWDFKENRLAKRILEDMELDPDLLPPVRPTVGLQSSLSPAGAAATGLKRGTPIGYRAGDQPNNALALNVLQPGEVAATAGTSGVVYAVSDRLIYDEKQRVNSFAHVNHRAEDPRIGVLLCINGAGILHRWVRQQIGGKSYSYEAMESIAASIEVGADGLSFLPFGNGAERMLGNRRIGAHLLHLELNRHTQAHIIRAGIEGIAFAFVYGMRIMRDELGVDLSTIRVGNDNLFQSSIFATTIATLTGAKIEIYQTTGAVGAALAGAVGAGHLPELGAATAGQEVVGVVHPAKDNQAYEAAYWRWKQGLELFGA
jgi:xylulokinase